MIDETSVNDFHEIIDESYYNVNTVHLTERKIKVFEDRDRTSLIISYDNYNPLPEVDNDLVSSIKVELFDDDLIEVTFDGLTTYQFNNISEALESVRDKHNENARSVESHLSMIEYDCSKRLLIEIGSINKLEECSEEWLTENYNVTEALLNEVPNFETEKQRRKYNNKPTKRVNYLMRKIPYNSNTGKVARKFITVDNIREATVEQLTSIDGIGEETARRCIKFAELDSIEINPEPDKTRVHKFKELSMENSIIKDITVNNDLKSYAGLYYTDSTIKIREDCENFHRVLAHEVSHGFDGDLNDSYYCINPKLTVKRLSDEAETELEYLHRVEESDGRNELHEKIVNVLSWIITHPESFDRKYPNLYEEFTNQIQEQVKGDRLKIINKFI